MPSVDTSDESIAKLIYCNAEEEGMTVAEEVITALRDERNDLKIAVASLCDSIRVLQKRAEELHTEKVRLLAALANHEAV